MKKNIYIAPKSRVVEFRLRTHIATGSIIETMSVGGDDNSSETGIPAIAEGKQSGMWSYLELEDNDDF